MNAAAKNAASKGVRVRTTKAQVADAPNAAATRKPSLTDLPEPELRAKLLISPTLPDSAWAPKLGKPGRADGESRTAYIERVLAAE